MRPTDAAPLTPLAHFRGIPQPSMPTPVRRGPVHSSRIVLPSPHIVGQSASLSVESLASSPTSATHTLAQVMPHSQGSSLPSCTRCHGIVLPIQCGAPRLGVGDCTVVLVSQCSQAWRVLYVILRSTGRSPSPPIMAPLLSPSNFRLKLPWPFPAAATSAGTWASRDSTCRDCAA